MKQIFLIVIGLSLSLMADFTRDDATGVVTDNTTTLQWQDNVALNKNWTESIAYCEGLFLASHRDWRLPNINELSSIKDRTKNHIAMDNIFQSVVVNTYWWSSTTPVDYENKAWVVYFNDASSIWLPKTSSHNVRCVRDGQ